MWVPPAVAGRQEVIHPFGLSSSFRWRDSKKRPVPIRGRGVFYIYYREITVKKVFAYGLGAAGLAAGALVGVVAVMLVIGLFVRP